MNSRDEQYPNLELERVALQKCGACDRRWHKGCRPAFRRSAVLADVVASPKQRVHGDPSAWLGRQDFEPPHQKLCPAGFTERADRARACWESGARSVATFALHDRVGPIGFPDAEVRVLPPQPASTRRSDDRPVERAWTRLDPVTQEGAPSLGRRSTAPKHVLRDTRLSDLETELEQLPWMRGAPHNGFSALIRRISARSSAIFDRPPRATGCPADPVILISSKVPRGRMLSGRSNVAILRASARASAGVRGLAHPAYAEGLDGD